jgi:hypothetical protein
MYDDVQAAGTDPVAALFEENLARHKDGTRAGWLTRRTEILGEIGQLEGYARRSNAQEEQLQQLTSELTVIGSYIDQDDVRVRSETIARATAAMADPANLERPDDGSRPGGAPALVKGLGDRQETAAEIIRRSGNPWRDQDGGPLAGRTSYGMAESGQGLVSRAHTALEALEGQLGHDGSEKLAQQLLADSYGWPGMTVRRSRDEAADAAQLVLALSNPHYLEAFRSVMRYPMEFTAGGTGFETMSPEQREA